MSINNEFVHLNIHSEYSIIDGLIKISELINLAYNLNYNSLAITDFSNLFGVIEFYESCCMKGIKPIIGSSFYLLDDYKNISNITILALSNKGYKNLILLISDAYKYKNESKYPFINYELLKKYNNGLLILLEYTNVYLEKIIFNDNDFNKLEQIINFYKKFFKNRFYIELFRLGKSNEDKYISNLILISKYYKIPIVATNKVRFLNKKDFYFHSIKTSIYNNKLIHDNLKLYTSNQFFKNKESMYKIFSDIPEALLNSIEISKRCNVFINLNKKFLPEFKLDKNTNKNNLIKLSNIGLKNRLKSIYKDKNKFIEKYKIYKERLNKELKIINEMKFTGYFLIVMEFINWAKINNISIGPGRGSGAGSLVSYSLNITNIDPVFFDLIFERFLNYERTSMPDLDIDFCMEKRDLVIEHVIKLYGKDFVSKIITFGSMTAKSVIKDVGRVLGYSYNFINKISMLIPLNPKITLEKSIIIEKKLYELYKDNKEVKKIINISKKLEGYIKNVGKHAGGLVISPYKITNFMPLYYDESNISLTQFNKKSIEKIGLVKFDFLGLKTLTIINNIIKNINSKLIDKNKINISNIPLDDKLSFNLLKFCKTTGIFQLESNGIKDLIRKLKPNCFKDIVDLIALFRPGPLKSGMVENFINRKNGLEKIYYPDKIWQHKLLKDILLPTYGIILYQEQIIKIAQVFSNYSPSEADTLRQVISSKNIIQMHKQKLKFINGAIKNGINEKLSNKIFYLIEKFASYGFNKSHSVSYALISYQMLWLKSNYTIIFMSEVMTSYMNNCKKIENLINECKVMKIKVLNLNINYSKYNFYVNNSNNIEYGLGSIKGIGENSINEIIKNRDISGKFNNILDLCIRIDRKKLSKKSIELLITSGAFDFLNINNESELNKLNFYIKKSEQINKNKLNKQIDIFGY